MPLKWISLLCLIVAAISGRAQGNETNLTAESGQIFHRNYSANEYGAAAQNWGSVQDKNGIMFFANGDGVLTYDGKKWTLIETPAESVIRSIAMDHAGRIYAGGLDEIGYLDKAKDSSFVFVSLLPKLKQEQRATGNVWSLQLHNGLLYCDTEIGLLIWNGKEFSLQPWPDATRFHKIFFYGDNLFAFEEGRGLCRFENGKFPLASDGEIFRNMRIYGALPMDGKLLLATKADGLYIYDGVNARPFNTSNDTFFKENLIYTTTMLPDSTFAIGTRLGGVVTINRNGNMLSHISKQNGLPTNSVLSVATDRLGDLWIGLELGISHFEINNGLRYYNDENGLESAVNDICRFNGKVYVATGTGTFVLQPASWPDVPARFVRLPLNDAANCWSLLSTGDRLFIVGLRGVFEFNGKTTRQINATSSFASHRLKGDPNRIFIAQDTRLLVLKFEDGQWREAGEIPLRLDNVKFTETIPGKIWIGTYSQGATLISFPQENGKVNYDAPTITRYGPSDGLPEGFIKMNSIQGRELFRVGTASTLLRFDYATNRFVADTTLIGETGIKDDVFPVSDTDAPGTFMLKTKRKDYGGRQIYIASPSATGYSLQRFDMSRIRESVGVMTFAEEGDVLWHIGASLMVRQQLRTSVTRDSVYFKTYLNKVILSGDSVFHAGPSGLRQEASFPYERGSFRFEFTATNLLAEEANTFQHMLKGYDDEWSAWSDETVKEYSQLWEGDYTFMVRSRNYAGVLGEPVAFSFSISPPWYRSIFAYVIYALAFGGAMWALVRWRSYQLLQEQEALKKEIASRTQEIREQNVQLAEQSEELRVNAEQLHELDKLKSTFFVNISHEFRSPLSLILSPLEKYITTKEPGNIRLPELERMHRNALRLQQLINQLLDLARLESGGMKLAEQQADFFYFLRVLTASFESLAEMRNIRYEVVIPPHTYITAFDNDKVETVLYNLLSNAFKFTPDGGQIDFIASLNGAGDSQCVLITVADTGPGIPAAETEKIFDRFYQVDSSSSRLYEGSGIGLSLVKELVTLMKGTIAVTSEMNKGSAFTMMLPLKGELSERAEETIQRDTNTSGIVHLSTGEHLADETALSASEMASSESLVLIVEDNADLRGYLRENLEGDYTVVVAENGQAGLEKAFELTPDLILSDMMMPHMDGFTLCTRIREDERTSHIPFILLTARATIESKLEGLELGADEYMTKPFNIQEIRIRIKNVLEQRRNLRKSYSREVMLQPKNIAVTSVDERFLNHVMEIMENHVGDEQFSVERFAEEAGMSRKNLLRKVKALTGQSVNEFIRNFRLRRAVQLIEGRTGTVSEIAYQVGFNNLSYFSKCFKEFTGILPNEYPEKKA